MKEKLQLDQKPYVVGVVNDWNSLNIATWLTPGEIDFIEIRMDAFIGKHDLVQKVYKLISMIDIPLIITIRSPDEGGLNPDLTNEERVSWFRKMLRFASIIDIESDCLEDFKEILQMAKSCGVIVIASHHQMPGCANSCLDMKEILVQRDKVSSFEGLIDIMKIAAHSDNHDCLDSLILFLRKKDPFLKSVMCVGGYGMLSRLVFAQEGSVLNYGYLGNRPVCVGQWPATQLKALIKQIVPQEKEVEEVSQTVPS